MEPFATLREEVIGCRRCPRLVAYRERLASERTARDPSQRPWGRPVPGFGDPTARLVVIGLAPGARGSNRTGRMFTGDRSADFLVRGLHRAGFANQPTSTARSDGLRYTDLYLTAAVRCVPPENRPTPSERTNCRPYLEREMGLLRNARSYLALGGFAWEATLDAATEVFGVPRSRRPFTHGGCVPLGAGRPMVWGSYHPSPQNTNTGRLTEAMFDRLVESVRASWTDETGPSGGR